MAGTGLKIVTRHRTTITDRPAGPHSTRTEYVLDDRRREEWRSRAGHHVGADEAMQYVHGPLVVTITRCDLGKRFRLNLEDCEYESGRVLKYPRWKFILRRLVAKVRPATPPPPPTILIETTTVDTGERKEIFGCQARHTITTRKETSLDASDNEPKETAIDGWYIDRDTGITCDLARRFAGAKVHARLVAANYAGKGRRPQVPTATFRDIGTPEMGYAIAATHTHRSVAVLPDGTRREFESTFETQVTELTEQPLDPALFEIPPGFRRVRQIRQNPPTPPRIEP